MKSLSQSFTLDYNWARMVINVDHDVDRYRWRHWLLSRWRDKWREEWRMRKRIQAETEAR